MFTKADRSPERFPLRKGGRQKNGPYAETVRSKELFLYRINYLMMVCARSGPSDTIATGTPNSVSKKVR